MKRKKSSDDSNLESNKSSIFFLFILNINIHSRSLKVQKGYTDYGDDSKDRASTVNV